MEKKNINENIVYNDQTLTKRIVFANENILSFVINLKVGQTLPVHKHENSSLQLLVLSGTADLKINDEVQEITKGITVMAKGEDDFSIPEVYEDLSLFVIIAPNPTEKMYSKNHG